MSSANMLLETSKAKTTSTPSLLTVFNFVPIFGLVKEIIKKATPTNKVTNFKVVLKVDIFGANFLSNVLLEKARCVLFFHHKTNKKITIIAGTIVSR